MKKNKMQTNHSSSFGRLWSYLQAYRFPLYLAIFLKIVSVIMSVLEPVVIGLAITELTKNTLDIMKGVEGAHINVSYVGLVLVVYLLRGLIYELAAYYSNYFMTNAVQATVQDMRNEMTEKINRTSVSYFDKHQFGDLLGRFTSDVETVSNALQQSFLQVVNAVFTLALVIGTVLYLNLQLGAIVVITIPITFFGARYIMSKSQPYFKQQADALGTLNGFVQENLTGFNVLKLFGREDRSLDDFKEITEDLQKVGFKANFISGLMMPVLNGLSDLTYLIVAVLGGLQVLAGHLTIGNMQAFVQYVWQINQPIQNLTQLAGQLQSAKSSLDRIFQLMDEPDEANDATEVLAGDLTGQVSFKHVDFQYVADKPLIRDFNLEVNPGEMVAIVGPTGAGKSTIINLLMRFYDVTAGSISVDGHDIRNLSRQDYRKQFGMVLQDAWLFEGTIKENLRFGNLDATDEEIVEAAKAANVDHFIRTLPGGYNMEMNQESSNISLGQKQLLTIARALMRPAPFLILDDSTSALDYLTESRLLAAIRDNLKSTSLIIISQRTNSLKAVDQILVLDKGHQVGLGNHEELLATNKLYQDIHYSQHQKEVADEG